MTARFASVALKASSGMRRGSRAYLGDDSAAIQNASATGTDVDDGHIGSNIGLNKGLFGNDFAAGGRKPNAVIFVEIVDVSA